MNRKSNSFVDIFVNNDQKCFWKQLCQSMSDKAWNWQALSHEQHLAKHLLLYIFYVPLTSLSLLQRSKNFVLSIYVKIVIILKINTQFLWIGSLTYFFSESYK